MNKNRIKIIGLFLLIAVMSGCSTYEGINKPLSGTDQSKIARFEYMESQWSYMYNRWIRGQTISPEYLVHGYGVPEEQAKGEVTEFVQLTYNYNFFHRMLISFYLNSIKFYVGN